MQSTVIAPSILSANFAKLGGEAGLSGLAPKASHAAERTAAGRAVLASENP
ncbi:hypothetical protein [Cognatilysobacter terrigena]|uniref:hypothetical protein n=1 Tax=Cognatilysobacter terrigena TaxID=2488749 RepID=UPI001414FD96|nr:hypothetical protein [Lysobacter terrigena]